MKDYTDQIENNYKSHVTDKTQTYHMEAIRHDCQRLAGIINKVVPDGGEKSIALMKLEEVMFWANAGIARSNL